MYLATPLAKARVPPPRPLSLDTYGVKQILTGIRGCKPDPEKVELAEFAWKVDENEYPTDVTCPQGQRVEVQPEGTKGDYYRAYFAAEQCVVCPLAPRCRAIAWHQGKWVLKRLRARNIEVARKRRLVARMKSLGCNLRAAVEATIRSCKHPFGGKAPVRGQIRVSAFCIAAAIMVNVRRIWRYEIAQREEKRKEGEGRESLLSRLGKSFRQWLRRFWPPSSVSLTPQPTCA
jgi:hypothetical protein